MRGKFEFLSNEGVFEKVHTDDLNMTKLRDIFEKMTMVDRDTNFDKFVPVRASRVTGISWEPSPTYKVLIELENVLDYKATIIKSYKFSHGILSVQITE